MQYQRMNFSQLLKELDSEEKARAWIWLAKFDGKVFHCPKCAHEKFYQHKKNPEIRECKNCHLYIRLRANTIFQHSKTPMLTWLKAICFVAHGKRGISTLELQHELGMKSYGTTWAILHKIREPGAKRAPLQSTKRGTVWPLSSTASSATGAPSAKPAALNCA